MALRSHVSLRLRETARLGGGALAVEPDGTVIVGGGADPRVLLGDILRPGYISRINPTTGALTTFASGFSAASGLDVAANGTIYATNDFGGQIGRLQRGGKWSRSGPSS